MTSNQLYRETEETVITFVDLMLLNDNSDRKFELSGGFNTDPRYHLVEDEH